MPLPLIPTNTVAVSPTYHPPGWLVGAYDDQGFINKQKWFSADKWDVADSYAREIEAEIAKD